MHGPDHQGGSRRWSASSGKRAAPRPPPIPRRCRCSRRSIVLKPHASGGACPTWYSTWAPESLHRVFRHVTPDHVSPDALVDEMNDAAEDPRASRTPGRCRSRPASTCSRPGSARRSGSKISAADLKVIARDRGRDRVDPPVGAGYAKRLGRAHRGRVFLDIELEAGALSRYGLLIDDAQLSWRTPSGGDTVTTVVKGRERYPVNVRYGATLGQDIAALNRVLVPAGGGRQVPARSWRRCRRTRTRHDSERRRVAHRLRLRRHRRPRPGDLRRGGRSAAAREG